MTRRRKKKRRLPLQEQWYKADLHIHTPASADYQQEHVSYLDILQQAERQGLDIIAFTDHNTVAGYKQMNHELEDLALLERLGRLNPEEEKRLQEYRRLLTKILVLKGFEFTATFGFHILGLFPPEMPLRDLEFLLLQLNIALDRLDDGITEVGATSDVLTAYRLIDDAGGIVIAAHANSSHGVALQGLSFGGQTRIAFTQDSHLHALEVTDLEKKGGKTTTRFFDGSKPEYPRRMRCIQGSDTHRLTRDPKNIKNLGIGDRATEMLLEDKSFVALHDMFTGDDFASTRPYRPAEAHPFDFIQAAREEGPNIVQEFHEQYGRRGGYQDTIIADVCAFANTNGGALYIGVADDPKKPPIGVGVNPTRLINQFIKEIEERISPMVDVKVDAQETQGVKVLRIVVPSGAEPPYTLDESTIYIRSEAETTLAVRDEIVALVKRSLGYASPRAAAAAAEAVPPEGGAQTGAAQGVLAPPHTGVEIASTQEQKNTRYYTMRDLRNGNLVKNVTRRSARNLWRYAIEEAENNPVRLSDVHWVGDIGLWKSRKHSNQTRYDLVQRLKDELRVYYGVTEEGLHGPWAALIEE
ncbi:MAG: putative DNA binding domain-containing protein [Anaerolineae bacterium]|nr:putative DNA binding domain-containing protein [Anaerolineae bacterium]